MIARRLIVNADDFGLATGIDNGIIEAAALGTVSSVSVMTNLYHHERLIASVARLRAAAPTVGLGLHFNCLAGRPLTDVPRLVDQTTGEFLRFRSMLPRLVVGSAGVREIGRECDAQMETLSSVAGPLSHVNSHLHLHMLPSLRPIFFALVRRYGIPHLRWPIESARTNPLNLVADGKKLILHAVSAFGEKPSRSGRKVHFAGMSLRGNHWLHSRMMHLLNTLAPGTTELMVHPGFADPDARRYTSYVEGREIEHAVLTSMTVRARLRQGDITLTHF